MADVAGHEASRMRPEETRSPSTSTGATASAAMPDWAPSVFSTSTSPLAALAEAEVVAGHDARRADLAGEQPRDELLCAGLAQLLVELEHQHRICAGVGEQPLALVERGEAERRRRRA